MGMHNVQIAATFTAEPCKRALEFLLTTLDVPTEVAFAPFNQVFQSLLDQNSSFGRNEKGINVVLARLEDLGKPQQPEAFRQNCRELVAALRICADRSRVPLVLAICPASRDVLGDQNLSRLLTQNENDLTNDLRDVRGLHIINSQSFMDSWDRDPSAYDNPQGNRIGAICYTDRFYTVLGYRLARYAHRLITPAQKVIVLDCDQTLWKGVCGEDGPFGIEIDEPRRLLQEFMLTQYEAGMLLCLCSKNNEADVWQVFTERKEMPLQREHLAACRINWNLKSENLKSLSDELQLGLDTFIFVDDDRVVCAEVEANCPEVLTICLPQDATTIATFLREHWAFDHLSLTSEDSQRTRMYRENAERNKLQQKVASLGEFLKSLDLHCEIGAMKTSQVERVAQLTQRTNQFNATTIRRSESEISRLLNDGGGRCLVVSVRDRFGDYGLVGAVIYFIEADHLEVDSFLLSCRALGRGIEHRMLAALGERAIEAGKECVSVNFNPSKKNSPAWDFFDLNGADFKQVRGSGFVFHYPAQFAARLVYSPDDSQSPGKQSNVHSVATEEGVRAAQSQGLGQIARELHSVDVLMSRLQPEGTTRPDLQNSYVAPASLVETKLVELWQDLLRVQPIGVTDNFFELGGDSLLGVSLLVEIEEAVGRELSLANLLTAPTVKQLAVLVSDTNREERWRYLVPIQASGNRPTLFCMHAAGGNVLFYRDLAQHLGSDHPVYGLQAREEKETGTYPNRVEAMASHYVEEILDLDPRGPYHLCGSSFGGLVAYEVAQQLRLLGREIALLALFDTYGPGYPQPLGRSSSARRKLKYVWSRIQTVSGQLRQLEREARLQFIKSKAHKLRRKIRRKLLWKKNDFQIKYNQATGRTLPIDLQRNHKAIQQALDSYTPRPYEGKLTLFRAAKQPPDIVPDPFLGWSNLASEPIELFESPGVHGAMTVDPYARSLAEKLAICFRNDAMNVNEFKSLHAVA